MKYGSFANAISSVSLDTMMNERFVRQGIAMKRTYFFSFSFMILGASVPAYAASNVTGNNTVTDVGSPQIYGDSNKDTGFGSIVFGAGNTTAGDNSTAIGGGNTSNGLQGSAVGTGNVVSSEYGTAVGAGNSVDGTSNESSAIGSGNSVATSTDSAAIGNGNQIIGSSVDGNGNANFTSGSLNYVTGTNNSAIGYKNTVDNTTNATPETGSLAIGNSNTVSNAGAYAIGNGNNVSGANAFVIGNGATAAGSGAFVIGNQSMAGPDAANSVVIGNQSYTDRANVVSVGSDYAGHETQRQIVNVAAGTAGTDAVNVNQLNSTLAASEKYADDLFNSINTGGGGSGSGGSTSGTDANAVHYDDSSKKTATMAGTNGTQIKNVAAGTAATDAATVGQVQASSASTLSSAEKYTNDNAVTYDSQGGKSITLKSQAQIHNLAAGSANTDAANLGQVRQMNAQTLRAANDYTDRRIDGLSQKIQTVKRRANAGIASALAVASIPQASPGKSMLAGGVSEYNGQEGFAVGFSRHWQFDDGDGAVVKIAGTANSQGDGGFAVGAGYEW